MGCSRVRGDAGRLADCVYWRHHISRRIGGGRGCCGSSQMRDRLRYGMRTTLNFLRRISDDLGTVCLGAAAIFLVRAFPASVWINARSWTSGWYSPAESSWRSDWCCGTCPKLNLSKSVRMPASRARNAPGFRNETTDLGHWIPAFAGMSVVNWSICDSLAVMLIGIRRRRRLICRPI